MSVKLAGPSLEQNYGFIRTKYGAIPRFCVNKIFWHNEHQDGSGQKVPSEMVFIPRFKFDRDYVINRGLAASADIPAALDGQEFGGFWIDKYICSQPNASMHNPYPDVAKLVAPGLHAARSQQGVSLWDFLTFDQARLACENRGEIITGTANSGTTTTLVCSSLPATQLNYYVGWQLKIIAGTNAGEAKDVIKYDQSTKTLTVKNAFTNPIDTTSQFRLTQFHLVQPIEWAALAYLSLMLGTQPHGNNNNNDNGQQIDQNKDVDYPYEKGLPSLHLLRGTYQIGVTILTGTGPNTFAHNHHSSGVFDLNGNPREYVDMQINNYIITQVNNDIAHPAVGKSLPSSGNYFNAINSDSELMKLAFPIAGNSNIAFGQDTYTIGSENLCLCRGGLWYGGTGAGIFNINFIVSSQSDHNSFRAALSTYFG